MKQTKSTLKTGTSRKAKSTLSHTQGIGKKATHTTRGSFKNLGKKVKTQKY